MEYSCRISKQGCHSHHNSSPSRALRKEKNTCNHAAMRLQPLPMVRNSGEHWGTQDSAQEKCRILGDIRELILDSWLIPDSWDAYERNDFSKLRLLHLPMQREALNLFTWDNLVKIHKKYFWCSDYLPFVANFSITRFLPLTPQSSSVRVTRVSWDAVSQAWNSKNSHQIKQNSQPLGCDDFLSQHS